MATEGQTKFGDRFYPNTSLRTFSGEVFNLALPDVDRINVSDIAHGLSNLCRFNGHCRDFYSVAEHSVLVASLMPEGKEMYGLLHDAHETYIGDVITPMKNFLSQEARDAIENLALYIDGLVWEAANISPPDEETLRHVTSADRIALGMEARALFGDAEKLESCPNIFCLSPAEAEESWLAKYFRFKDDIRRQ